MLDYYKLMHVNVKRFSIQEKIFIEKDIIIDIDKSKKIDDDVYSWCDNRTIKDVVIRFENKYFILKSAFIVIVNMDTEGIISSCKLKFDKIEEITRKYKLEKLLKI